MSHSLFGVNVNKRYGTTKDKSGGCECRSVIKKRLNNTVADCQTDPNDYRCPCPRCDPPGSCNCPLCNCNINPTDCYECPCTLCLQRIVSYCPPICDVTPCCDACGGFVASGTCPK